MNELQNIEDTKTINKYRELAKTIIEGGLTPLDTEEQVICAIMMGQELGFKPMMSVQHIVPVNGKATLDVQLMNATALSNGVFWKILKQYEVEKEYYDAHYNYYDEDIVKKNVLESKWQLFSKQEVTNKTANFEKDKKVIIFTTDRVTRLYGRRKLKNGEILEHEFTFKYSEAVASGLVKPNSIWEKRPSIMCLNRAMAGLFRLLISDLILGVSYDTSELKDVYQEVDYVLETEIDTQTDNISE